MTKAPSKPKQAQPRFVASEKATRVRNVLSRLRPGQMASYDTDFGDIQRKEVQQIVSGCRKALGRDFGVYLDVVPNSGYVRKTPEQMAEAGQLASRKINKAATSAERELLDTYNHQLSAELKLKRDGDLAKMAIVRQLTSPQVTGLNKVRIPVSEGVTQAGPVNL